MGDLYIKVINATDLNAGDRKGSDPYVTMHIQPKQGAPTSKALKKALKKQKTKIQHKTLTPVWNEAFKFTSVPTSSIRFNVKDRRRFAHNNRLGYAVLDLDDVAPCVRNNLWLPLNSQGRLHVEVVWLPDSTPEAASNFRKQMDRDESGNFWKRPGETSSLDMLKAEDFDSFVTGSTSQLNRVRPEDRSKQLADYAAAVGLSLGLVRVREWKRSSSYGFSPQSAGHHVTAKEDRLVTDCASWIDPFVIPSLSYESTVIVHLGDNCNCHIDLADLTWTARQYNLDQGLFEINGFGDMQLHCAWGLTETKAKRNWSKSILRSTRLFLQMLPLFLLSLFILSGLGGYYLSAVLPEDWYSSMAPVGLVLGLLFLWVLAILFDTFTVKPPQFNLELTLLGLKTLNQACKENLVTINMPEVASGIDPEEQDFIVDKAHDYEERHKGTQSSHTSSSSSPSSSSSSSSSSHSHSPPCRSNSDRKSKARVAHEIEVMKRDVGWGYWTFPEYTALKLRGKSYMEDRIKFPAKPPKFDLVHVDMWSHYDNERCGHAAERTDSFLYNWHEVYQKAMKARGQSTEAASKENGDNNSLDSPRSVNSRKGQDEHSLGKSKGGKFSSSYGDIQKAYSARELSSPGESPSIRRRPHRSGGNHSRRASTDDGCSPDNNNNNNNNNRHVGGESLDHSYSDSDSDFDSTESKQHVNNNNNNNSSSSFSASSPGSPTNARLLPDGRQRIAGFDEMYPVAPADAPLFHKKTHDFMFIVQWIVPGTPRQNLIFWFALPRSAGGVDAGFDKLMRDFCDTKQSDQYRDKRFKFIPRVVEGSWMVRRGCGQTPAILGKKLTQSYYGGEINGIKYFEVDVDVGSSKVAGSVLKLVKGYARSLVIEMYFLLEGQSPDELPEHLIGGARLGHVDLDGTTPVDGALMTRKR